VGPERPKRKTIPQTNSASERIETLVIIWKCLPLWLSHNRPKKLSFLSSRRAIISFTGKASWLSVLRYQVHMKKYNFTN